MIKNDISEIFQIFSIPCWKEKWKNTDLLPLFNPNFESFLSCACVFDTILTINFPILYLTSECPNHFLLLLWILGFRYIFFAEHCRDKWLLLVMQQTGHIIIFKQYLSQYKQDLWLFFCLLLYLLQQKPAGFQQARNFWHLLSGPVLQIVSLKNEDKALTKTRKRVAGACYWLFLLWIFKDSESQ